MSMDVAMRVPANHRIYLRSQGKWTKTLEELKHRMFILSGPEQDNDARIYANLDQKASAAGLCVPATPCPLCV